MKLVGPTASTWVFHADVPPPRATNAAARPGVAKSGNATLTAMTAPRLHAPSLPCTRPPNVPTVTDLTHAVCLPHFCGDRVRQPSEGNWVDDVSAPRLGRAPREFRASRRAGRGRHADPAYGDRACGPSHRPGCIRRGRRGPTAAAGRLGYQEACSARRRGSFVAGRWPSPATVDGEAEDVIRGPRRHSRHP
jgi:hypothetical protein